MCFKYSLTYHQQQNIWHPKGVNLSISKLQSILAVVNLFVHNNMTIAKLLYASKFATAKNYKISLFDM